MNIVYLVSGAGGMYCGSCLHANALARAVRDAGHEILLAPAYTPIRTDEENVAADHIVFGGLNVYLQERFALFRRTPRFVDRLLDAPWLLRWVGRLGATTSPKSLGPLTVAMLEGEHGRLQKELDKLVDWLAGETKPDVVHLSNVLLVGMARRIAERLDARVVCSLTGEDAFLEELPPPHYERARELLRERCGELDALIALNEFYADRMRTYLDVPTERVHVVRPGLDLADYDAKVLDHAEGDRPLTIGFLSKICLEKGLDRLVEAWLRLRERPEMRDVRLKAAGYLGAADRVFLKALEERIAAAGASRDFEYVGEPDHAGKVAFLRSIDVTALPSTIGESKGLPLIESLAAGTPVVAPDHGALGELIADTGGGLAYPPGDDDALRRSIERLLADSSLRAQLAAAGRDAVRDRHHADRMARDTIEVYGRAM